MVVDKDNEYEHIWNNPFETKMRLDGDVEVRKLRLRFSGDEALALGLSLVATTTGSAKHATAWLEAYLKRNSQSII